MQDIKESDWKVFRGLRELALERYCRRVLEEVGRLCAEDGTSSRDRYHKVYGLIKDRDDELAKAFDDPRRSMALIHLMWLRRLKLLNEAEFAEFTPELRARVDGALNL